MLTKKKLQQQNKHKKMPSKTGFVSVAYKFSPHFIFGIIKWEFGLPQDKG
jgi:hypothetical protein